MNPYELADNRNVGLFGLLEQGLNFAKNVVPLFGGKNNNEFNQTPGNPVEQRKAEESKLPPWVVPTAIATGALIIIGGGYLLLKKG